MKRTYLRQDIRLQERFETRYRSVSNMATFARLSVILKCLIVIALIKFTHFLLSASNTNTQKTQKFYEKLKENSIHETVSTRGEKKPKIEDTEKLANF